MFRQISSFVDSYLAKQPHGRNKGYITQYFLLVMLEKCKSAVNNEKYLRALLTDISKAFDCLSPKKIVSKLRSYDFDLAVLKLAQITYQTYTKYKNEFEV